MRYTKQTERAFLHNDNAKEKNYKQKIKQRDQLGNMCKRSMKLCQGEWLGRWEKQNKKLAWHCKKYPRVIVILATSDLGASALYINNELASS